jgi:uncharacterized NAD(P)/FAD-binding protein YdhS
MKSDGRSPVAIVGAGFSGTMLAAQLARRGIASRLIEGGGRAGRGTAYSTREPAHLLNVRAEGMSAWPEAAGDFASFFALEQGGSPRGFAERRLFGRYVTRILEEAVQSGQVEVIRHKAVAAERGDQGWRVTLDDGAELSASALVLAHGNQPPEPLRAAEGAGQHFIGNPWSDEASTAVAQAAASGEDVLLIGTGLTMIDLVLSLDAAGHGGRILALSRRGLLPRAHGEFTPAPADADAVPEGDLNRLWRWLRRRSGEVGWRAAVDSLRPHSQRLWMAFGARDQARFLRHARPWWDVHRHRIAPEIAERLRALIAEGRLEIVAGRIAQMAPNGDRLRVEIVRRGRGPAREALEVQSVFNCTGPLGAIARTRDPMLRQLLDGGAIAPDALGMGLEVDARSRVHGSERLWALGPLTRGRFWEIVAVPDIRLQAAAVADDIARELGS